MEMEAMPLGAIIFLIVVLLLFCGHGCGHAGDTAAARR